MFAGRVEIVSHLSCRTSAIFKYFCPLHSLYAESLKLLLGVSIYMQLTTSTDDIFKSIFCSRKRVKPLRRGKMDIFFLQFGMFSCFIKKKLT